MILKQLRKAETLYIFQNILISEISQEMEIPEEEFMELQNEWEHRRQAYRTAEYFFCREEKTIKEITALTPLTEEELTKHLPVLEQKRKAYLQSVPSTFLQVHDLLEERINDLTLLVSLERIQKLHDSLKPTASVFDHYELILNIITQHFIPTKHLEQSVENQFITLLEEFRGFLKMQILSGNR